MRKTIGLLLGVILLASCSQEKTLKCNYAAVDISTTAEEHTVLAGFAARNGLSTELHKPLYSHCLVLTDGTEKVCVISNDLMEISPDLSLEWRKEISEKSGLPLDRIFMHCIHTHSAPRNGGVSVEPGGSNYTHRERMHKLLVENAVATINGKFQPFSLEVGKGTTTINGNRCEKETGPVDRDVYVARFLDKKGAPIVSIVNVACHPVTMGPGSYLVSSDYPGVCGEILKEAWGGDVFQLTGAAGNMDPARGPKRVDYTEEVGRSLADSILAISFRKVDGAGLLRVTNHRVALPYRIPEVTPEAVEAHAAEISRWGVSVSRTWAQDVEGWKNQILRRFEEGKVKSALEFNMGAINVDGVIFFFTQGEPFCEYQTEIRTKFPYRDIFFAGYTNGQNSYLPSKHAFDHRIGYEYEIDQMHVYIKAPYPLSSKMPAAFSEAVLKTVQDAVDAGLSTDPVRYDIIPTPKVLEEAPGAFVLSKKTGLKADDAFAEIAADFRERVKAATGFSLEGKGPAIVLKQVEGLGPEAYRMEVAKKGVTIEATGVSGAFYGLQTLLQLLPAEIFSETPVKDIRWEAPCCRIEDEPAFAYRGLLFDSGRFFFEKEELMKFIDLMAMHKQNIFHWHLTEDQGWRIQIDKYPRLTEVGAWRRETVRRKGGVGDGTPHGGFYTKDDIREVVEYARRRCVTVVPEVELPGHSTAAIAAYPWLSCFPDREYEVETRWGIWKNIYCPTEETFTFLEDVFTELFDLFPSPYYHIGGDEAPKDAWERSAFCQRLIKKLGLKNEEELQTYFVRRMGNFLKDHGKTVIGWDEILDGGALEDPIAMSYRGHAPAARGIRRGLRVILTPNRWCYLDNQQQDQPDNMAQEIFMPLRKVYNYYPAVDSLADLSKKYIIGYEACLWTEYIDTPELAEYFAFPRELAAAETAWTDRSRKDWSSFRRRMEKGLRRLDMKHVGYCPAYYEVIFNYDRRVPFPKDMDLELDYPDGVVRYTLDGTEVTASSPVYDGKPFLVDRGSKIRARGYSASGEPLGAETVKEFAE